ncbi:MAG: pyruvate kinase, partial [Tepidisphaeraceae bacterium]
IGPSCNDEQMLHRVFEAGADACRLNFSHGSLADHARTLAQIRQAVARRHRPIAVLGDLCGPKIRVGKIEDANGMGIEAGDVLTISREPVSGAAGRISTTCPQIVDEVRIGDRVLIEDGLLRFVCVGKIVNELQCQCTSGGVVREGKGINLPNTRLSQPAVTERDWEAVRWAIEHSLDYLALSFVRSADDMRELRAFLTQSQSDIQLIAKIEKAEAVANIDAIIDACDGLMIARGDLGVEMDVAQVPLIQKSLILRCQQACKPVIVATQMLQSMIENTSPTRAEVSDVANAIFDGADVVMLSAETAIGRFPEASVHMMSHIAQVTESYLNSADSRAATFIEPRGPELSGAIARGVRQIAQDLGVGVVVVYSLTGATARVFSKHRFSASIVAFSSDERALRRMALLYGVAPYEMPPPSDVSELVFRVDEFLVREKLARPGDRTVIVAGSSLGTPGTMNGVVVHTVGEKTLDRANVPEAV